MILENKKKYTNDKNLYKNIKLQKVRASTIWLVDIEI